MKTSGHSVVKELEISPEMIDAGIQAFSASLDSEPIYFCDEPVMVIRIYEAMCRAKAEQRRFSIAARSDSSLRDEARLPSHDVLASS